MGRLNQPWTLEYLKTFLNFFKAVGTGDDKGIGIIGAGQLSVGSWDAPAEFVAGQGDSTTDTMMVLHSSDGANFTDITEAAASDASSTFNLFGGDTAGNTIYVGGDFQFMGAKVKIVEQGTIEPENVDASFWSGAGWSSVRFMSTNPENLVRYNNKLASNGACCEHWRFDFDPYGLNPSWVKSTINGVEKYWAKFEVLSDITKSPILEQLKMNVHKTEINGIAGVEYFGYHRPPVTIFSGVHNLVNNAAYSPADENVEYSPTMVAGYKDNELSGGALDSKLFKLKAPQSVDTSIVAKVEVSFYVKGTGTGDVELRLKKVKVNGDFKYDGSGTEVIEDTVIVPITTDSDEVRKVVDMYMDISDNSETGYWMVSVERDGSAGNPNDTLSNAIILTDVQVQAYKWRP